MEKKIFLIIIIVLLNSLTIYAQPNCYGKLSNDKDDEKATICFKRVINPLNNITKYTLELKTNDIFEVNFNLVKGKDGDSISIQFIDKEIDRMEKMFVNIKKKDSRVIIKNYKTNEENINDFDSTYSILFSIDSASDYITLYQFKAPTRTEIHFYLQPVQQSVINNHLYEVSEYKKREQRKKEIADQIDLIKNKMIKYKDTVIQNITTQEMNISNRVANIKAPDILQKEFKKILDDYFIRYFSNVFPFTNNIFDATFTFDCKGNGKITVDPIKTLTINNGVQNNWFRDSFNRRLIPLIEIGEYQTSTETKSYPKLIDNFKNWFEENIRSYEAYRSEFETTIKQIQNEFAPYKNPERTITIPTKYIYSFKYTSTVINQTWKYKPNAEGRPGIKAKSGEPLPEILKQNWEVLMETFTRKINPEKNKFYNINICVVYINDIYMGLDVQPVN